MRMDISASLFQIVMGLAVYLVIAAVLIAVSVIDFRTRRIPNEYVLALLALRLVVAAFDALWGSAFAAFASLATSGVVSIGVTFALVVLKRILEQRTQQESLGWGDVKLLAVGCLFLDLQQAFTALLIASLAGVVLGVCFRSSQRIAPFPSVPALCLGIMTGLFV